MSRRENIGDRLRRLRVARGLSQRDLASPGVSFAYISRIEAGMRTPSVKALRKLASNLGVSVEQLETGTPTPIEEGVAACGLDFGSLTSEELGRIQDSADEAAREAARRAADDVLESRREQEIAALQTRLDELGG